MNTPNTPTEKAEAQTAEDRAQFTPGPWHVAHSISDDSKPYVHMSDDSRAPKTYECVIECDEYTVATTGDTDRNTAIANARLIAAAPELLVMLRAYVELEESAAPYSSSPMREKARAAIAKVEGK